MAIEIHAGDRCSFEGCDLPALSIACGRGERGHDEPNVYCETHRYMVADEDCPEYIGQCPNCGCSFGIN